MGLRATENHEYKRVRVRSVGGPERGKTDVTERKRGDVTEALRALLNGWNILLSVAWMTSPVLPGTSRPAVNSRT